MNLDGYIEAQSYASLGEEMPFMRNDQTDLTLTYSVSKLLKIIIYNRDQHLAEYYEAHQSFLKKLAAKAADHLEVIQSLTPGKKVPERLMALRLEEPSCHVEDYDHIISMLQLTLQDEIELPYGLYLQVVRDQWSWKDRFNTLYAGYTQAS